MLISRAYRNPVRRSGGPCKEAVQRESWVRVVSEYTIVERVRDRPRPMAVSLTFRQRPELVSAIIDPAAKLRRLGRRNVVALVSGVHKQERVPGEFDLHQPSAYLWHDREPQPFIGQLHGIPALEFHRIRAARGMNRQTCREPY